MEDVFSHYSKIESLYTETVYPVCEKHGITYMEFTVLMFLANNPQFDTASDIVKFRRLTKSHVSMSINSLENKGLLKGERDKTNRRAIRLTVLENAKDIVLDGKMAQEKFFQILFGGFSKTEYSKLLSFIDKIDKNISTYAIKTQRK